jgi:hypothetical protein
MLGFPLMIPTGLWQGWMMRSFLLLTSAKSQSVLVFDGSRLESEFEQIPMSEFPISRNLLMKLASFDYLPVLVVLTNTTNQTPVKDASNDPSFRNYKRQ